MHSVQKRFLLSFLRQVLFLVLVLPAVACHEGKPSMSTSISPAPIDTLGRGIFLPENLIARDSASGMTARYTDPTTRYRHGILGDAVEGGGLLVVLKGKEYYFKLDENHVFEDLMPRLADVDGDGVPELVTIRSSLTQGGGVAVYKIKDDQLQLFAESDFIGMPNRWLNLAAITDLDGDGTTEIAWVQTPHIGGTLKIARIDGARLRVITEMSGCSNHRIGSRNLCLSVVTQADGFRELFLPTNAYDAVVGLRLREDRISETSRMSGEVDAAKPLINQFSFDRPLHNATCIDAN